MGIRSSAFVVAMVTLALGCGPVERGLDPEPEPEGPAIHQSALGDQQGFSAGNTAFSWKTVAPSFHDVMIGLQVRSNTRFDGLRVRYRDAVSGSEFLSPWVGTGGGFEQPEIVFNPGERLTRIEIASDSLIRSVKFITSSDRMFGPFGGGGGTFHTFETPVEEGFQRQIHGFDLGADLENRLNWIRALHYQPRPSIGSPPEMTMSGGWGGSASQISLTFLPRAGERLSGLWMRLRATKVTGLNLRFTDEAGIERFTGWIGSRDVNEQLPFFNLLPDEFVTRVVGRSGRALDRLVFETNLGRAYGGGSTVLGSDFDFITRMHGGLTRRIDGLTIGSNGSNGENLAHIFVHDRYGPCEHLACDLGGPMRATCDPCVKAICEHDSFCCDAEWDGICTQHVTTQCGLTCVAP